MRAETGVMQFEDDWPGVFIRGDNAMAYAMQLQAFLDKKGNVLSEAILRNLVDLLRSCDARNIPAPQHATLNP